MYAAIDRSDGSSLPSDPTNVIAFLCQRHWTEAKGVIISFFKDREGVSVRAQTHLYTFNNPDVIYIVM